MKAYDRAQITVTDLTSEDVILTSGVDMNSPNYQSDYNQFGFNWTLWQ